MNDSKNEMKFPIDDGINYRQLAEDIEIIQDWSGHFDIYKRLVTGLETYDAQKKIIEATAKVIKKIEKEDAVSNLQTDYPTFLFWVISLMYVSRTLDILKSKSIDKKRESERGESNLLAYAKIYQNYRKELQSIIDRY